MEATSRRSASGRWNVLTTTVSSRSRLTLVPALEPVSDTEFCQDLACAKTVTLCPQLGPTGAGLSRQGSNAPREEVAVSSHLALDKNRCLTPVEEASRDRPRLELPEALERFDPVARLRLGQ